MWCRPSSNQVRGFSNAWEDEIDDRPKTPMKRPKYRPRRILPWVQRRHPTGGMYPVRRLRRDLVRIAGGTGGGKQTRSKTRRKRRKVDVVGSRSGSRGEVLRASCIERVSFAAVWRDRRWRRRANSKIGQNAMKTSKIRGRRIASCVPRRRPIDAVHSACRRCGDRGHDPHA